MPDTLVIVHLCSIDSYITHYGIEPAKTIINDIRLALITHPGPIIIMDQDDETISDDAKTLRQMVLELQKICSMTIFHHDELTDVSPWQDGMKALAKLLHQLKTSRVRLGGFWTSQNGGTGCVHEVQRHMRARNIPCYIDKKISALEENDTRTYIGYREGTSDKET